MNTLHTFTYAGNACSLIVIIIGNEHDNPSSNPGQVCLRFT